MPSYDYKCAACGVIREFTHSIDSDFIYRCPDDDTILTKVFRPLATHFKGSGWGGNHPVRTYRTRSHADAATGEIGSQTTVEVDPENPGAK